MGSGRHKKEGRKLRSGRVPPVIANGYIRKVQGSRGNRLRANMSLDKAEPNNGPGREAKKKLSPPRAINRAQLAISLQRIGKEAHPQTQSPTDPSPRVLAIANSNFWAGNEVVSFKPNQKASVKGRKVTAHARASQAITSGAADRN